MTGWLDPVARALDGRKAPLRSSCATMTPAAATRVCSSCWTCLRYSTATRSGGHPGCRRWRAGVGARRPPFGVADRHSSAQLQAHESRAAGTQVRVRRRTRATCATRRSRNRAAHAARSLRGRCRSDLHAAVEPMLGSVAAHYLRHRSSRTVARRVGRAFGSRLTECPIHVDWFAKQRQERMSQVEWSKIWRRKSTVAAGTLGVMLHHAVMDDAERLAWHDVLRLLARHPNVTGTLMRDAARDMHARRVS